MNIVAKYLKDKDRSASWLARQAKLAPSTVIAHAAGKQLPCLGAIRAYHAATGIPLGDLARWEVEE